MIKTDMLIIGASPMGLLAVLEVEFLKLKLILCRFHEAILMYQSTYQRIFPGKKYLMKHSTFGGVTGFEGSKKEAPKTL